MRAEIVRIGNSRGIRIPKPVIEQCGFGDTVQLHIENDRLVIAADRAPRQGWAEAFQTAGTAVDDELMLEPAPKNRFDREEWEW
ncbi:MAG: AbrB/MazE/SpoVT family DNA-binding domain-containing protein [Bryobacteraceae bacterium]